MTDWCTSCSQTAVGRKVPRQVERADIVKKLHDDCGLFGIKRMKALANTKYWWHGMFKQVRLYVRNCDTCARVQASFVPWDIELHQLPMMGMFYRRFVDPAGPFSH